MKRIGKLAYLFSMVLFLLGCIVMYAGKGILGKMFGASAQVNREISEIIPIFLFSVPFVAVIRVTTASFYAAEKNMYSYILALVEPLFMLFLMLILPLLFVRQITIW